MKLLWYFVFSFLFSSFKPMVRKKTWMRTTFVTVMVIFSRMSLWKLLDHTYVQSSFSTVTRHICNGIWETLYSSRFYRMDQHMRNSILVLKIPTKDTFNNFYSWLNTIKLKLAKARRKWSVPQRSKPVPWRT